MQNQEKRARAVKATIAFLENTSLAPDAYERELLNHFIAGELTIAQVLERLEKQPEAAQTATPRPRT
jgi:hypothetical protein